MASITYPELFSWAEIENLGDLERFRLVLENLPDEKLMQTLEEERANGRDDYPVRPLWNSLLAMVVCEHKSVESLRRELKRNGELRGLCGFDPFLQGGAVPPAWVYSRFLAKLQEKEYIELVKEVFEALVRKCYEELPGFGKEVGADGKAIPSFAVEEGSIPGDRRGEHDADWGKHEHFHQTENGEVVKKVKKWFGFTVHLLAETNYELPIAFELTKASRNETTVLHEMLNSLSRNKIEILDTCRVFTADRGYDDTKLIEKLWQTYAIKPVIDIRNMWKDSDKTKQVPGCENAVYDYKGTVSCICPKSGKMREMSGGEFEQDRETLKFRCPAEYYGYSCGGASECKLKKQIRIRRKTDPRVFTPISRASRKWKDLYKRRTAAERINSRLDVSFGFEQHTIRGQDKMTIRLSIGFAVMLSIALGRVRENNPRLMRSLVMPAA
jgi:hypothetical protein